MKKIRKGNDIDILWKVFDAHRDPYDLTGASIKVYLVVAGRMILVQSPTVDENKISFTYAGKDQQITGMYGLLLVQNDGHADMVTHDVQDAFSLVPHSWLAGGHGRPDVDVVSVEVSSELNTAPLTAEEIIEALGYTPLKADDISGKADKAVPAAAGNIAILDGEGNLADGGKKVSELYQKPASGIPASDIADGVIPDVSNFITKTADDLVNYYLKSETYTKSEVEALIGAIQHFHYEVYASTSAVTNPQSNVLYLIGPTGSGSDRYEEYVYTNNTWTKIGDTSIDLTGYVTTEALNAAFAAIGNEEDIDLNASGKLQFANRAYNSQTPEGMGYKILRKNASFVSQVTEENTFYEIRYPFNLNGATITIPSGCVLRFVGGSLSNGILDGYQFKIESEAQCFSGIVFSDSYVAPIHSRWFVPVDKLSKKNTFIDCSTELQGWANCGSRNFYLDAGLYYVANTIVFDKKVCIDGDGNMLTPRQDWPENYWEQSALIFTNLEIPVINFVIGADGYKAFNLRNVGFANINKTPSADNIPIVKLDLTNSGIWGLDFSACIYGAVNGTAFNHTGYQFNASGTAFIALSRFGGAMDKLNRCIEFNKAVDASGWNNLARFDQIITNCNEYIYAPDFLNWAVIEGQIQLNVNNTDFFNNYAFCNIAGSVIWNATVADFGGSGTSWSSRYLVRSGGEIIVQNGTLPYAFVRKDGSPINYNSGSGNKTINTNQTNSLLALLTKNTGTSLNSLKIMRAGTDYTSKFEQGQVIDMAASGDYDANLGADVAANADTSIEIKVKFTQPNYLKNVVLFLNSKAYTNKSIRIDYYKSNNQIIGYYSVSGTTSEMQLPIPSAPTNTYYAIVTYSADTFVSSQAPFAIPTIGIDSKDTTNNFLSPFYNAPRANRSAMLLLPTDSNDANYEVFDVKKKGKWNADDAASFVYLCTQRSSYSVFVSNSFKVLANADGKQIRFEISSLGQGANPTIRIYGDSKDVPFDIAAVVNTTAADRPNLEIDFFVRRSLRYMSFVIVDIIQNTKYSELGEVYIKGTKPTLSDPANAYYKHSIGTVGATADRPAYPIVGDQFFDTTLLLPIWNKANGVWIDSAGNTV